MNLKREVLSLKELILIGILIILVAYYFVVQGPIQRQTKEYQNELAEINSELQIAQEKAVRKMEMQKAIDAIFARYDGNPPMTPEYNNINYIIGELNGILGDTYDYNLAFGKEAVDENHPNIVRRPISIRFSTNAYEDAIAKIEKINTSPNKYLIRDVSVTDSRDANYGRAFGIFGGGSALREKGRYSVEMTMTSFEYTEEIMGTPVDTEEKKKSLLNVLLK